MRKLLLAGVVLISLFSTACVSLFSEIHNETHHHHGNQQYAEELEHRIDELEERLHHLMERQEGEGGFEGEREEEDD